MLLEKQRTSASAQRRQPSVKQQKASTHRTPSGIPNGILAPTKMIDSINIRNQTNRLTHPGWGSGGANPRARRTHHSPTSHGPIRRINGPFPNTFPIQNKQFLLHCMMHVSNFVSRWVHKFVPTKEFESIPKLMTSNFDLIRNGHRNRSVPIFPNPRGVNNPSMVI